MITIFPIQQLIAQTLRSGTEECRIHDNLTTTLALPDSMNSHFHHDVAVAVVVIVVVVVVELTSSSAFFLLDTGRRLNIFFRFWPRLTSPFRLMGLTECDLKNLGYPTLPRPHLKKTSNITAD